MQASIPFCCNETSYERVKECFSLFLVLSLLDLFIIASKIFLYLVLLNYWQEIAAILVFIVRFIRKNCFSCHHCETFWWHHFGIFCCHHCGTCYNCLISALLNFLVCIVLGFFAVLICSNKYIIIMITHILLILLYISGF